MGKIVRWGIIGAGTMAHHFAEDLAHCVNGVFHGVVARTPERAEALASAFGGTAYSSIEELLDDPSIDAVYIATPNSLHAEHAKLALRARKPVLCEKPFAINSEEADEVIALAKAQNVFCMEAMWMRFLPSIQNVVSEIEAGAIGPVRSIRAELGFPVAYAQQNRFSDPLLGGGALLDLGVYGVSLVQSILGTPIDVAASAHMEAGVDVNSSVLLTYPEAQAVIVASHASELTNTLSIAGERGRITISGPFIAGLNASLKTFERQSPASQVSQGNVVKRLLQSTGLWPLARKIGKSILRRGKTLSEGYPGHGYQFQAEAVGDALARGETECALMPLSDTLTVMQILTQTQAHMGRDAG